MCWRRVDHPGAQRVLGVRGEAGGGVVICEQVVRDFVVAARLLAAGEPELAVRCVLPSQVPVESRVPVMVVSCPHCQAVLGTSRYLAAHAAEGVVVCWRCCGRAVVEWDSGGVPQLRITTGQDSPGELLPGTGEGACRAAAPGRPLVELPLAPGGWPVPLLLGPRWARSLDDHCLHVATAGPGAGVALCGRALGPAADVSSGETTGLRKTCESRIGGSS
jgi:hypothetical protein